MTLGNLVFNKAMIKVIHTGAEIYVDYNPEEYTINQDNNFASQGIPGLPGPVVQYVMGNQRTLEMELLFDTWDSNAVTKQDVRRLTDRVTRLMNIDPELHAPPKLEVRWGTLVFTGVLTRATQRFILFTPAGVPVRARLNVTFSEVIDPEREVQRIKPQTAHFSKLYTVGESETLSSIAARMYENPRLWRAIAIENGVLDARRLTTGQSLVVPPLPYVDPETGEVIG